MNKNRLVALGLILFVLLFTFPVLMNLGKSVAKTQPPAMLQDQKAMQELADKLGMSVGGLNYCLNALIDKGFVKMANFSKSKNKFKYVYLLTPQGIAEKVALTSRFLKRKMEEYDALKVEIEALKAEVGEDQGESLKA